jgi:hypothetical protein
MDLKEHETFPVLILINRWRWWKICVVMDTEKQKINGLNNKSTNINFYTQEKIS